MKWTLPFFLACLICSCFGSNDESNNADEIILGKITSNESKRLFSAYWFEMSRGEFTEVSSYLIHKNTLRADTLDDGQVRLTYVYSGFNELTGQNDTLETTLSPHWTKAGKLDGISLEADGTRQPSGRVAWHTLKDFIVDQEEAYGAPTDQAYKGDLRAFSPDTSLIISGLIDVRQDTLRYFGFRREGLLILLKKDKYQTLMNCRDMVWDCHDLGVDFRVYYTQVR